MRAGAADGCRLTRNGKRRLAAQILVVTHGATTGHHPTAPTSPCSLAEQHRLDCIDRGSAPMAASTWPATSITGLRTGIGPTSDSGALSTTRLRIRFLMT